MSPTNYYIIQAPTKEMLGVRVTQRLKLGWEPLGGIAIDSNDRFYQAMVKYDG